MSNYGVGYDDESGGLLRLRGKVREKGILWFSYRDSWRREMDRCLPRQVTELYALSIYIFTVWKLFQTLLFVLLPHTHKLMEKEKHHFLTVYFYVAVGHGIFNFKLNNI